MFNFKQSKNDTRETSMRENSKGILSNGCYGHITAKPEHPIQIRNVSMHPNHTLQSLMIVNQRLNLLMRGRKTSGLVTSQ
jgi:hypothetical protein